MTHRIANRSDVDPAGGPVLPAGQCLGGERGPVASVVAHGRRASHRAPVRVHGLLLSVAAAAGALTLRAGAAAAQGAPRADSLAAADSAAAAIDRATLARAAHDSVLADSVVVKSPLPGGLATVTRFIFNVPQWLQIAGIVLGAVVASVLAWWLWKRREPILLWLRTLPKPYKVGLATAAGVGALFLAGSGAYGWNYMQHDNGFCTGCHVMTPAFGRFQTSEHRKLQCHDCHRQSIFASAMELYVWIKERPEEIPPHAPVPSKICAECHVQVDADSGWRRIVATAGHRVHLFSDSSALKGKVECVTCHGQEVHRFVPVDKTCGQSGCHESTPIRLGKMRGQTSLHCVGCHAFTAPASEVASVDSSSKLMSPNAPQCLGCHEMQRAMGEFDPRKDPHDGSCGACHNPHEQRTPAAAFESCATSGCHANTATETPMHRGLPKRVIDDCGSCHEAHEWTVKSGHGGGQACLSCHQDLFGPVPRGHGREPRAGARTSARGDASGDRSGAASDGAAAPAAPVPGAHQPVRTGQARGRGPGATGFLAARPVAALWACFQAAQPRPAAQPAGEQTKPPPRTATATRAPRAARAAPRESGRLGFSHRIHRDMACEACHSSESRHGETLVRSARDCAACHHNPERVAVACEGCHTSRDLADTARIAVRAATSVAAATAAPHERVLPFAHRTHRDLACTECHTTPVTLAPSRDCTGCHAQHHEPARDCLTCHQAVSTPKHTREVHLGCTGSGCHVDAAAQALPASRSVCLTCHADQVRHKPGRECADCHRTGWNAGARSAR